MATHPFFFFWKEMERQVRIEGIIFKLDEKESDDYFISRPIESQISAWISPQSTIIPDRKYLNDRYKECNEVFQKTPPGRPPFWGGFRLVPDLFEFWQGREKRLHDRIEFKKEPGGWIIHRLAP